MKSNSRGYKNLSQEYITKALLALMEEKAYDEISITEITKKAQLARRTFYLNFSSKQEILDGYFEVLFMDFMDSLR
ncbi:MAG: TetR/AcrR family transcriptional regulator, partial [Enterococcus sp.]|nr:TetR/AcrR family transcriptional regulator [Enterococcus sp.]